MYSQPRQAGSQVSGRTTQVLREALHIFEATAKLLTIKINGGAAHADYVKRFVHDPASTFPDPSTDCPDS